MTVATFHFEIDADEVERAKRFYEKVFGWKIRPWGPPDYYLIETDLKGVSGDIRMRDSANVAAGRRGFVCTIGVGDVKTTTAAVLSNGGKIDTKEMRIEGVGNLAYFVDTEGNRFGVMQRDRSE
jgi:predicted enzyme related to lactoylglutathione lyase